jgi:hypothetical protein
MRVAIPLSLALLLSVQGVAAQTAGEATFPGDQHIDTVTVEASNIPLEKAIAGFVKSYAAPSIQAGKIPKWASGICPTTEGLTPELNLGVTTLLKLVAAQVGAPVVAKVPCDMNVEIIFTRTPQAVLDDIAKNYEDLLGYHDISQTKRIATMSHPIQAWYATSTRSWEGRRILDTPNKIFVLKSTLGGRLQSGYSSEISYVTIVVDVSRLGELGIKPVADYVAMLALSQTKTFETCQPLASITNLLTPGCDTTFKPNTFSSNDIAYLSALYKMNPYNVLQGQQSSIAHQMETALGVH